MAITLRGNKSQALTFNEMDGNFTDLNGRTTTLEGSVVKTINGVSPSSNALTITTANITENTNLYYTDARSRAAVSVTDSGGDGSLSYNSSTGVITYTGPSASEVRAHFSAGEGIDISAGAISGEDATASNKGIASFSSDHFTVSSGAVTIKTDGIDDTHIDFGTGANQVSTADLPEQTNLYFTNARGDARIAAASIGDLSDVTLGSSQVTGHGLVWNGGANRIELAELPGAAGGEANKGQNVGGFNQIFQGKAGVTFNFRTIDHGDNITITQNTDDIKISLVSSPEFGNLKINSGANTIENIATNANVILKPNGTGTVDVSTSKITSVVDPTGAQDAATKAYVDSQISGLNSDKIIEGNSQVEVVDSGTGTITHTVDGVAELTIVSASSTFGGNIIIPNAGNIGSVSDTNAISIAAGGDVTLTQGLIVTGNLTVNGTTTTVNSAELKVDDINITLADGAADSAAADGAGITIDGADATITYTHSGTKFNFNKPIDTGANNITTTGTVSGIHSGNGAALTALNGSNIATGTVAAARVATLNQNTTGSAATLTTARAIALSGDVVGTANFDGSAGISISTTIQANSVALSTDTTGNYVAAGATSGSGISGSSSSEGGTFTVTSNATNTNAANTIVFRDGSGNFSAGTITAALSGNATTASSLASAVNIGGVSFDGSGSISLPGVNASGNQNTSGTAAVATTVTVADESADTSCNVLFTTAATGNLGAKSGTNLTFNSSSGQLDATTFNGVATSAQYADLAEKYTTDEVYPPGTIMQVGGDAETTLWVGSPYIAGVISTNPAYLMNSELDGQAIALVGRVPVRVIGSVTKGQAIKADSNGVGSTDGVGPIVGIALETNSNLDEKSVECMLKV